MQAIDTVNDSYAYLQSFIQKGDMLLIASGVAIGMATKDLVERILNKAVAPLLAFALQRSVWALAYRLLESRLGASHRLAVALLLLQRTRDVLWDILLWLALVFLAIGVLRWFLQTATRNRKLIDAAWYEQLLGRLANHAAPARALRMAAPPPTVPPAAPPAAPAAARFLAPLRHAALQYRPAVPLPRGHTVTGAAPPPVA
jgi:large-conductance mechanosensitive channel